MPFEKRRVSIEMSSFLVRIIVLIIPVGSWVYRGFPLSVRRNVQIASNALYEEKTPVAISIGLIPAQAEHVSEDLSRKTHVFDVRLSAPLGLKLNEDELGVYISSVENGMGAEKAGLRVGDRVIATSATIGDAMWPKKSLAGVESSVRSRLMARGSVKVRIERNLDESEAAVAALVGRSLITETWNVQLKKPLGLTLSSRDGKVIVKATRKGGSAHAEPSIQVGDAIIAIGNNFGPKSWIPVQGKVERVINAATGPSQSVRLKLSRQIRVGTWSSDYDFTTSSTNASIQAQAETRVAKDVGRAVVAYRELVQNGVPGIATEALLVERASELCRLYSKFENRAFGIRCLCILFDSALIGVRPTQKLLTNGITAYITLGRPELGAELYEKIRKAVELNNRLATAAITAFTRLRRFERCFQVVATDPRSASDQCIANPDAILCNALLAAASKQTAALEHAQSKNMNEQYLAATRCERLFEAMRRPGGAEEFVYGLRSRASDLALLLDDPAQTVFGRRDFVYNKDETAPLLATAGRVLADDVSFNIMIDYYARRKQPQKARATLDAMRAFTGIQPGLFSYTALVKAYAEAKDPDAARAIFDQARKNLAQDNNHLAPLDANTWNTLIRAYGTTLRWREAYATFQEMKNAGITPTIVTYTNLASAALSAGRPRFAIKVLNEIEEEHAQVKPNVISFTIKIRAYAKLGQLPNAVDALTQMRKYRLEPNKRTVAALLEACLAAGQPRAGQALIKETEAEGLSADLVTNTLLLRCHLQAGDAQLARDLLLQMHQGAPSEKPNIVTYNAALRGFFALGCLTDALDALQGLVSAKLSPNKDTWLALSRTNTRQAQSIQIDLLHSSLLFLAQNKRTVPFAVYERYLNALIANSIQRDEIIHLRINGSLDIIFPGNVHERRAARARLTKLEHDVLDDESFVQEAAPVVSASLDE
uniref:PDZ domain-containing protein n=1 Tax=Aureoumbra lagunensis TaxID=44058 RepID=A0A7S3JYF5_9STRA